MVVLVAVLVGAAIWQGVFRNDYPCNSARSVGVSRAIDGPDRPLPATPQDALRGWAANDRAVTNPAFTRPADGWILYRGRWVHDLPGDSFYEVSVTETPHGWFAGSYSFCTR